MSKAPSRIKGPARAFDVLRRLTGSYRREHHFHRTLQERASPWLHPALLSTSGTSFPFPSSSLSLSGLCMRCLSAARQGCMIGRPSALAGKFSRFPALCSSCAALPFDDALTSVVLLAWPLLTCGFLHADRASHIINKRFLADIHNRYKVSLARPRQPTDFPAALGSAE